MSIGNSLLQNICIIFLVLYVCVCVLIEINTLNLGKHIPSRIGDRFFTVYVFCEYYLVPWL